MKIINIKETKLYFVLLLHLLDNIDSNSKINLSNLKILYFI